MKIRILYKSGNSHEFWVYSYRIKRENGGSVHHAWEACDELRNSPIMLGVDEVEAVWQVDHIKPLFAK
jgi:hypothetical protein